MKHLTKYVTASLLIVLFASFFTVTVYAKPNENNSSLVIVKVEGLDASTFNKLNNGIAKNTDMSLEYSCLQSDIIVIKYVHDFSEKGDVQHYINSAVKKWLDVKSLEFIFIDIQTTGVSKC